MPIRKITNKTHRVKVVNWIRSGAPYKKGVSLLALIQPKANISPTPQNIDEIMCGLLGITSNKFKIILKQYHGKKKIEQDVSRDTGRKFETKIKPPKRSRSFRKEWPFLSRPECPAQLKALAADKITCWERYTEAHKQLFDCESLDDCKNTAATLIENFKENRQIFEELDYYKKHGGILGKHRIFKQYERFNHLAKVNVIELVKLHENTLPHRIWRIKSEIAKGDKPHLLSSRNKKLYEVESELAEVKRLLGINA